MHVYMYAFMYVFMEAVTPSAYSSESPPILKYALT